MSRSHTHRTRRRALVASTVGIGIVLTWTLAAVPAYAADGFTDEQKNASYASEATAATGTPPAAGVNNWSIAMMDVFDGLRTDRGEGGNAEVMDFNDALTSRINLTASEEERARAIVDQYGDMALTMSDGLGAELGDIYASAWAAGELPKTQWLLSKNGGRVGASSSSNPPKNFFDFDRPYLRLNTETQLAYYDRPGGDGWASTSGAFPSGHASQAYWQGVALANLLPELAPQILARASEAGNNRIILAAHYPLDVISGRMMGEKIVQLRLEDEKFRALMDEASAELRSVLEAGCGADLQSCISADEPYLATDEALKVYAERLDYGFPRTGEKGQDVVVPEGAESLLISSQPDLTAAQRRDVLALTAADSGHPLDTGEQESWQRLNLAAAMTADVVIAEDGTVTIGAGEGPGENPTEPTPTPNPSPTTAPTPGPTTGPTPEPTTAPTPAPTAAPGAGTAPAAPVANGDDLPMSKKDVISAVVDGKTVRISGLTANERYYTYAYSTPTALGWSSANANGVASVTLSDSLAAGQHRIAVLTAEGALFGWTTIVVGQVPTADVLARTGADSGVLWMTALAGASVLAAGGVLALRHRSRRA